MKQTLTTGLLLLAVGTAPALALESPYLPLAQAGGGALVLAEEPAQNEDIKTIMVRYKQTAELEKIPSMPVEQRRKLMDYYKKGLAAGVKDRLLAVGMGSIVVGYSDIEAVKVFVAEYQQTGKMGKYLPLPHISFTNAAGKFPEAQVMFASELEATKKMEAQIKAIIAAIAADTDRRGAGQNSEDWLQQVNRNSLLKQKMAKARSENPDIVALELRYTTLFAEYEKGQTKAGAGKELIGINKSLSAKWLALYERSNDESYKKEADYRTNEEMDRIGAAAERQTAENRRQTAEMRKQIEFLDQLLKAMK